MRRKDMRLIEGYVKNFGKLCEARFAFSEGLNTVVAENGYGKSTLAAFLKAMLYGFDETRKAKLDDNERKRYEPWQGGSYGGSLTLEAGGRRFRIEREFGKKAADDELTVYDGETGRETGELGDSPGTTLFGIDRDGFERTVFLSERKLPEKNENRTVAAKLSDITEADGDLTVFDEAMKRLDEGRKFYRKQGGGGALAELERRLGELDARRGELEALARRHAEEREELEALERRKRELSARLGAERALREEESVRRALRSEHEAKRKVLDAARLCLAQLSDYFGGTPPTRREIDEAEDAKREAERLMSGIREPALGEGDQPLTSDEELDRAAYIAASLEADGAKGRRFSPLPFLSAALAILGAILGVAVTPAFWALCAVCAVLFVITLAMGRGRRRGEAARRAELEAALASLAARFSCDAETPSATVAAIRKMHRESEERRADARRQSELNEEYRAGYEKNMRRYLEFTRRFPTGGDDPIGEVRARLDEYGRAEERVKSLTAELEKFGDESPLEGQSGSRETTTESELANVERELTLRTSRYKLDAEALDELSENAEEYERLTRLEGDYEYRLLTIRRTMALLERAKDALNVRYLEKTKSSFTAYTRLISECEEELELDTSFAMARLEGGKTHPREAYSKGTQELYAFAIRLALSDALYEGSEKPFLVLDDPFAYYDDARLERALRLVRALASESGRQIIYFTATRTRGA